LPFVLVLFLLYAVVNLLLSTKVEFFSVYLKEKPCCRNRQLLYDNKPKKISQAFFKKILMFVKHFSENFLTFFKISFHG